MPPAGPRRTWTMAAVLTLVLALSAGLVVWRSAHPAPDPPSVVSPAPSDPVPSGPVPTEPGATASRPGARSPVADLRLPGTGDADLFVQTADAIYRLEPATGRVTRTATPDQTAFASLVAQDDWVLTRTVDGGVGVIIRRGRAAEPLPGGLHQAGRLYAAPHGDLWFQPEETPAGSSTQRITRLDLDGRPVPGQTITVPARWGFLGSDGTGQLLERNAGGTFLVRPDGTELISRGLLLAVARQRLLVWDCDARSRCGAYTVERSSGRRTLRPAVAKTFHHLNQDADPDLTDTAGDLSPDGRWAALQLADGEGNDRLHLVELSTGSFVSLPTVMTGENGNDQTAWSPNGRWFFGITAHLVRAFDTHTGSVRTLPVTDDPVLHLTTVGATGH